MAYNVSLTRAASKELDSLPSATRDRVVAEIVGLESNPRPIGCRKIAAGNDDAWRVRVGDCRVLYYIDDHAHEVRVFRIRQRREAYRRL